MSRVHPDSRCEVDNGLQRVVNSGKPEAFEYRMLKSDGTEVVIHQDTDVFRDSAGRPLHLAAAFQDITERRRTEVQIRELSYFDRVTGLPIGPT